MKHINTTNILLQNALSSELNAKLSEWKNLKQDIIELAQKYESMASDELLLENEWFMNQMNMVEKEFQRKQKEFHIKEAALRAIFTNPVYVN